MDRNMLGVLHVSLWPHYCIARFVCLGLFLHGYWLCQLVLLGSNLQHRQLSLGIKDQISEWL